VDIFQAVHKATTGDAFFPSIHSDLKSRKLRDLLSQGVAPNGMVHPDNAFLEKIFTDRVRGFAENIMPYAQSRAAHQTAMDFMSTVKDKTKPPKLPRASTCEWMNLFRNHADINITETPMHNGSDDDLLNLITCDLESQAFMNVLVSLFVREDILPMLDNILAEPVLSQTALYSHVLNQKRILTRRADTRLVDAVERIKKEDEARKVLVRVRKALEAHLCEDSGLTDLVRSRHAKIGFMGLHVLAQYTEVKCTSIVTNASPPVVAYHKARAAVYQIVYHSRQTAHRLLYKTVCTFIEEIKALFIFYGELRDQPFTNDQLAFRAKWHPRNNCSCNTDALAHAMCLIKHATFYALKSLDEAYVQLSHMSL
jgi:hypothetical protein